MMSPEDQVRYFEGGIQHDTLAECIWDVLIQCTTHGVDGRYAKDIIKRAVSCLHDAKRESEEPTLLPAVLAQLCIERGERIHLLQAEVDELKQSATRIAEEFIRDGSRNTALWW